MITRTSSYTLLAGLLWSAFLFALPPAANAGVILAAPTYMGLGSGLIGYWPFNGNDIAGNVAYDRSGRGNNGTLTNGPTSAIGKLGQALSFDGIDDLVSISNESQFDFDTNSAFSMSLWFYRNDASTEDDLIQKVDSSFIGWAFWIPNSGTCSSSCLEVTFHTTVAHFLDVRTPTGSIQTNKWHHAVFTYTGTWNAGNIKIYIDNVEQTLTTIANDSELGGLQNNNAPLIGLDVLPPTNTDFNGKIDEVRLYNRLLTADEVKRLYNIGGTLHYGRPNSAGSLLQGLVGWWTMDGADTDYVNKVAYDRSGNGNNGVIQTGPSPTIGKIGQAIAFHQETTGVLLTDPKLQNIHNISISAWIKLNSYPTCGGDIDIVEKAIGPAVGWTLKLPCNLTNTLAFKRNFTGNDAGVTASNNVIGLGNWYHVLATDASSTAAADFHIYVNGAEVSYQASGDGTGGQENDAGFDAAISDGIDGTVDDVRVYNRVLTPDEIKRLYNIGGTLHQGVSSSNGSLSQGLVGWWTMDGKDTSIDGSGILTANDRSGNNNSALALSAAGSPVRSLGKIGQAISLDGANSYLEINSDPASLNFTTSFTVAGWIKLGALVADSQYDIFGRADSNSDGYQLGVEDAVGSRCASTIILVLGIGTPTSGYTGWCGTTNLKMGTWYHVAGVYNSVAQTIRLYVNGVDDAATYCVNCGGDNPPATSFPSAGVGGPTVGADGGNINDKFSGTLDDIRVYNRVLSADEIKRLYNMGR